MAARCRHKHVRILDEEVIGINKVRITNHCYDCDRSVRRYRHLGSMWKGAMRTKDVTGLSRKGWTQPRES